ncbi:hypothetical protein PhaeoP83_04130 (plasmid) [Phaeobacter inhibens]|uniref:Transposase n=1 Tax=Phaeobacter inhibens TaxID=221822 RepID=A0ABM6RK70_9RHOB|nr:hypothetical protein PhaeoP83_04130 [Phaeobacter inhibens]AUQ96953.1 hypothetical protein PhaeoP66_04227 [Phaeobacter inhibens]AUR22153.1 hypothetical protein PhaeoP80_04130 [Phaeobacter inhibens]
MPQPHEEERTFAASAAANHHRMEGGRDEASFCCSCAKVGFRQLINPESCVVSRFKVEI